MKKLKNDCHFINIDCTENFQMTYAKVWVSSFLSAYGNGIPVPAIVKKLKNGPHLVNINHTEKFQVTNTPKVWVSSFLSINGNGISVFPIMKKLKNGHHLVNIDHTEIFHITNPSPLPKFGSLVFQASKEIEY